MNNAKKPCKLHLEILSLMGFNSEHFKIYYKYIYILIIPNVWSGKPLLSVRLQLNGIFMVSDETMNNSTISAYYC